MKNAIKKSALMGIAALIVSAGTLRAEGAGNALKQGTLYATASSFCAALGIGASRVAVFRSLRSAPSQPATLLASSALFIGAHCFAKARKEFKRAPLSQDKQQTIGNLLTGSTLLTLPAGIEPLPLSNSFIGRSLKRLGTTSRVGIMAYGAYVLTETNTSLWRHQ